MNRDRRRAPRYSIGRGRVPCLVTFSGRAETLAGEIVNASIQGAFLYLVDELPAAPQEIDGGFLLVEDMDIPFTIVRTAWHPSTSALDRSWLAIQFATQPASFLGRLLAIAAERTATHISFQARLEIAEMSYAETVLQLAVLHQVLNAAAHILFLLRWRHQARIGRVAPPRIVRMTATSPLKGVVETAKDVVAVATAADDLLRHRKETKALKKEEVKQARERTRQERQKTEQEIAKSAVAGVDAALHEYTASSEALATRTEACRKDVELSREEIALFREKLAGDRLGSGTELGISQL